MSDSTLAVCYLYLSRVAEREGHPKAAERWRQKAQRWLETTMSGTALAAGPLARNVSPGPDAG